MAAAATIEKLTEAACKVGLTAALLADTVTMATWRTEFIDESGASDREARTLPCVVIKPGVAVPGGYKAPQHVVPVTVQVLTNAPEDLINATRNGIFESVVGALRARDFGTDFTSEGNGGTFNSCMVTGGSFRVEGNESIAEIETEWHVCT